MEVACGEGVLVTCKGKKGICGVNTGRDEGFAAILLLLFGFVLRASKYDVGDIGGVRVGGASIFGARLATFLLFGFVLRASKYDVGDIGGVRVGD
jgi:hypothetical protein